MTKLENINTRNVGLKKDEVEAAVAAGRKVVTTWSKRRPIAILTGTQKEFVEAAGVDEFESHFGGCVLVEQGETRKDEKAYMFVNTSAYEDEDAKLVAFVHQLAHALTGATTGHNYTWRRQMVRILVAVAHTLGRDEEAILELATKVATGNVAEYYNHWDREEDEELEWLIADEVPAALKRIAPTRDEDDELIEKLAASVEATK